MDWLISSRKEHLLIFDIDAKMNENMKLWHRL